MDVAAQHCRCPSSHPSVRSRAHRTRPAPRLRPSCAYGTSHSTSHGASHGAAGVLLSSLSSSLGDSSLRGMHMHSGSSSPSRSHSSLDAEHPYPSYDEEKDVSHVAFMNAFGASRPPPARVPGLQEFFAALWERRRRIPSQLYHDPLDHIFTEFDTEGTGSLTAEGMAQALKSYDVYVSPDAVQAFINATDANCNGMIEREEFSAFVYHVASADLRAGAGVCCSISPPGSAASSPATSASESTTDP